MSEYWNAELETRPWREVERWQCAQVRAMLPALRARSRLYARAHDGPGADIRASAAAGAAPQTPAGDRAKGGRLADPADLAALPFTFKDDLRAAQDEASDAEPFGAAQAVPRERIVQAISSSGTTGRPLYYALTARDVDSVADAIANVWFTAGIRPGDVVAHLVGLPMVAGGLPYADGFRRVGATLAWLGGFPTERILREMRQLRASALLATTSFALHLAEQWEEIGRATGLPSALAKVLGGGEPGMAQPALRGRIQRGLGLTHVRETMGLGDVLPSMWGECEAQDGMHFCAQRSVLVELVDPDGGARVEWAEGARGELVYTTFAREATPVVRYRSRDHAEVVGTACACGRTSPRIRVVGRTDDMLIYKGMNVFPTAVRDLVAARLAGRVEPLVRLWREHAGQVRFDDPIGLDVESSAAPMTDAARLALAAEVEALVRAELQVRVAVRVLERGGLPRGAYKNALVAVRGASA